MPPILLLEHSMWHIYASVFEPIWYMAPQWPFRSTFAGQGNCIWTLWTKLSCPWQLCEQNFLLTATLLKVTCMKHFWLAWLVSVSMTRDRVFFGIMSGWEMHHQIWCMILKIPEHLAYIEYQHQIPPYNHQEIGSQMPRGVPSLHHGSYCHT